MNISWSNSIFKYLGTIYPILIRNSYRFCRQSRLVHTCYYQH